MTNLEKFAQNVFDEYNSEGNRTVSNIKEVSRTYDSVVYEYDYTSLNGTTKRLKKEFLYDENGNMIHKGPMPA